MQLVAVPTHLIALCIALGAFITGGGDLRQYLCLALLALLALFGYGTLGLDLVIFFDGFLPRMDRRSITTQMTDNAITKMGFHQ